MFEDFPDGGSADETTGPDAGAAPRGPVEPAVDPTSLSDAELIEYVRISDRQASQAMAVAWDAARVLADRTAARVMADPETAGRPYRSGSAEVLAQRLGAEEVRQALRCSVMSANTRILRGRALHHDLPATGAALRAGSITVGHALVMIDKTITITDPRVRAGLEADVLPDAGTRTPGAFGRAVTRALHRLQPRESADRFEQAREATGVRRTPDCDGMSGLLITLTDPDAEWAYTILDTLARGARRDILTATTGADRATSDGVAPPSMDQLRAGAFLDLLQRATTDPGFPTEHGRRRIETSVVMTLDTLLGLRDDPTTVNGRPVPAAIARELASDTGVLRRLVTDPVTGHLLDEGTVIHDPSQALRDFVIMRDGVCRAPHCNRRATACDIDHAIPFRNRNGDRGPTSAANLGALCRSHHIAKTAGFGRLTGSAADGSAIWTTALGHRVVIPPRSVLPLIDPPRAGSSGAAPPDEPPPDDPPDDPPF